MKFLQKYIFPGAVFLILVYLYRHWFGLGLISASDFSYLYPKRIEDFFGPSHAWSSTFGGGLGGITQPSLYLDTYLRLGIQWYVELLQTPWPLVYRFMFFWPFLIVGTISSYFLALHFLKKKTLASIGALVYMSNTYILMIAAGGQMGLVIAYSFVPLALFSFIQSKRVLFTIATALLVLLDLRFSFLLFGALVLYGLIVLPVRTWWSTILKFLMPLIVIIGVHSFWIVPSIFGKSLGLPAGYGNPEWLSFLSWAEFSKTISLLHPNWPENIFGLTHFMQPEFIGIPILAFASLFFLPTFNHKRQRELIFLYVLAIIGAFLAKGVKPPGSAVYEWLFVHMPLFDGFRDPTKFYLLIAVSFSVLLPLFLEVISDWVQKKRFVKKRLDVYSGIVGLFLVYWIWLIFPALSGVVGGTIKPVTVPSEYFTLERFIESEDIFSRTLAVPWRQKFIYQTENHPVIDARDLLGTTDFDILYERLASPSAEKILKDSAIQYVVVPQDPTHEIFLTDRKYDDTKRQKIIEILDNVPYLSKHREFKDLHVYEYVNNVGRFYEIDDGDIYRTLDYVTISPVEHHVSVATGGSTILFSERYNSGWVLSDGQEAVYSQPTTHGLNSFVLGSSVSGTVKVYFEGEKHLAIGHTISFIFLGLVGVFVIVRYKKRLPILLLCVGMVAVFVYSRSGSTTEKQSPLFLNDHVWRSVEWKKIVNSDKSFSLVSRFGGSQIRFRLANSGAVNFVLDSSNKEEKAQGIAVTVDGVRSTIETPLDDAQFSVSVPTSDSEKLHDVVIEHYCASTLSICEMEIKDMTIDENAAVHPPVTTPSKTLAFLGDSITSSFGDKNYAHMVAAKSGYQLHNASVFGSAVSPFPEWDSALLRVDTDITRFAPGIVILFLGTNDMGRAIPLATFEKNYEQMIKRIRTQSPDSYLVTVGLMRRYDFPLAQIQAYSQVIQRVAQEHNIPFIDPIAWLNSSDYQDVVHPSVASQPKIANAMTHALARLGLLN